MGSSSSKKKESKDIQNINVIITINNKNDPIPMIFHNSNTNADSNIFENSDPSSDPPPPINPYDNGGVRVSIKDENGNIIAKNNQNQNYEIIIDNNKIRNSTNLSENTQKGGNIDINMGENQEKYLQNQTSTEGNININYGGNIYDTKKKETSKDLKTIEDIDVNIGRNDLSNKGETTNFFNKPRNIDINSGGNNKYEDGQSTNGFTKKGNIDINSGGNNKYEDGQNTNGFTKKGNIDINSGGNNKYEDEQNTNGFTKKGNIDINSGDNKIQEESTKSPYTKTGNIDINENGINRQINYDCNDLSMSYSVLTLSALNINPLSPDFKIEISKKINEGYFPLFIRIDRLKPIFFFVKNESTLKPAFYEYLKRFKMENDIEKYTLYNEDKVIDLNIPVKNLNIKQLGVISNIKKE